MGLKVVGRTYSLIPKFIRRPVITLSLIFALSQNPAVAQEVSGVDQWMKVYPRSALIIEKEHNADGIIYLVVKNLDLDTMIGMKNDPYSYTFEIDSGEFVCNSLKDFFSTAKQGQVAIAINLRTKEVDAFFDMAGNDVLKSVQPVPYTGATVPGFMLKNYAGKGYFVISNDPTQAYPDKNTSKGYLVFPNQQAAEEHIKTDEIIKKLNEKYPNKEYKAVPLEKVMKYY
jgi:hypothetical protein